MRERANLVDGTGQGEGKRSVKATSLDRVGMTKSGSSYKSIQRSEAIHLTVWG
jgi:hypothetical protein